jgi:hypothetical protein
MSAVSFMHTGYFNTGGVILLICAFPLYFIPRFTDIYVNLFGNTEKMS